jgi:RimJ/RimL family protein N-acetyltransferase
MMEYLHPGPAYKVITPRLVLRCWRPTDAQMLLDSITASREYLVPWMYWAVKEPTDLQTKIDHIRAWQANFNLGKDFGYGIFNLDESRVLGGTGLHTRGGSDKIREIGYWIHKDFAGQGLATEVVAALTKVGFEVDHLQRIEIRCDPANIPSEKVILKSAYVYEGTLRGLVQKPDGSYRDQKVFSLLASEYPGSPNAKMPVEAYDAYGRRII